MRLIDADAVYTKAEENSRKGEIEDWEFDLIINYLDGAPTINAADVAPVAHGQWYMLDDCANAGLYCSACGRRVHREEFAYKKLKSKYCPHCGARMDGGADHA